MNPAADNSLARGPDIVVTEILGSAGEPYFAGRREDRLLVAWNDASKSRLRALTESGRDVAVILPRGAYLRSGAVLTDDGQTITIVARSPERALVVDLDDPGLAARIGHAFGNQHVPIDIVGDELRVPITTSEALATETVRRLGARATIRSVELWRDRPPATGHRHA